MVQPEEAAQGRVCSAVSLVIPVRNEEGSLPALMSSIASQTWAVTEIILVDGGSLDHTVALADGLMRTDPRLRVISAGPATPGRGRNLGVAATRNDWIAFTDAGIRLEPHWLEHLVKSAEGDPSLDVVYGNFEPDVSSRFERYAALAYVPPKQLRPGGRMRGPSVASMLLRRRVWEAVGGFPDSRAAEDLIFMERIEQQGFKIGWSPSATVWWQIQPDLCRTFCRFVLYSRHNVWAGRQRYWHYGVMQFYLLAACFLVLGFVHHPAWLLVPLLGALFRVAKSIWMRREGRGLAWLLDPVQFAGVALILAAIDLATFTGWIQARWQRPQVDGTHVPVPARAPMDPPQG